MRAVDHVKPADGHGNRNSMTFSMDNGWHGHHGPINFASVDAPIDELNPQFNFLGDQNANTEDQASGGTSNASSQTTANTPYGALDSELEAKMPEATSAAASALQGRITEANIYGLKHNDPQGQLSRLMSVMGETQALIKACLSNFSGGTVPASAQAYITSLELVKKRAMSNIASIPTRQMQGQEASAFSGAATNLNASNANTSGTASPFSLTEGPGASLGGGATESAVSGGGLSAGIGNAGGSVKAGGLA